MKVIHCECDRFERLLRGLGRATSLLGPGWLALIALEGGPPDLRSPVALARAACLAVVVAASLLAWRREALGAVVALAAFAIAQGIATLADGRPSRSPAVGLLALPGLMFLLAWGRGRWRFHLLNRTTEAA
jgi:hypothetical protein